MALFFRQMMTPEERLDLECVITKAAKKALAEHEKGALLAAILIRGLGSASLFAAAG